MKTKTRRLTLRVVTLASIILAMLFVVACQQSQPPQQAPAGAESKAVATEKVFVVFEGPWSIVADPKDPNSILAIAPKTKLHRDLYVSANEESTLAAGIYDLSVPAHGPAASWPVDPSFAQAKIEAKNLQLALDAKSARYVIRLPKPEAYRGARRFRSRVGPTYPPDPATEQNYAAYVSLLYNVSTLNGFALAGSPDTGTFNPLLLQLETPTIRFAIEPAAYDFTDMCHTHSRTSFRDTAKFLGLTLYLDFPNDSEGCRKGDPQAARPTKADASQSSAFDKLAALLTGNLADVETESALGDIVPRGGELGIAANAMAAAYFFHGGSGACHAPILFLTTTP